MLVHLSSTSPYICDLSLGPIEQANRMSSAACKKSYLELKESFPRLQPIRTPLKLLAPDEVPMNTSVATTTTTDIDTSRQTSLQPVWYSEQTIVDDNIEQQRYSNHRPDLTRSTLPTIESNSPEMELNRSSLMRKSSTFTIEPQSSIDIPSALNDSGKENAITSTQQDPKQSDESFRALEHLLGLGSANINLTMTTTAQESPKSNHESLSLTVVTPTEIINQTTNSLHFSYAPAGGSLPSSQNILLMPTIESITEPSVNSTMPPPFTVDNSDTEEPSSTAGTVIHQDSYNYTDQEEDEEEEEAPKDDTDDFSFELNDFASDSKDESTLPLPPPPPPMITIRAPTSADVAYRALIKPRPAGRISQPVKTPSPLVKTLTARASVPNLPARVLRSSTRRVSTSSATPNSTIEEVNQSFPEEESFVNEAKLDDDDPRIELVEVVSLSEDEETEAEQNNAGVTLNLTESKEMHSASLTSAEEADRSASSSCSSYLSMQPNIATPTDLKMPVLSREFTYNTPTTRITRASERRRSILINHPSPARATRSLIPTIPEQEQQQQQTITEEENVSICSIPSSTQSTLSSLPTNPTTVSEAAPIVLQKSLAGSASPSPNATPIVTIRPSERLSSNLSPRRNINPLHSSTPSIRNKSLQIVSIGEQEQLSTTAPPQQLNIDLSTTDVEMVDNEQQIDVSIPIHHVVDEGIQTSPEKPPLRINIATQTTPTLDPSSRRRFQTIEQQTTPIVPRSSSCQTTPMAINRIPSEPSPSPPQQQQQFTPLHTKAIMHLRRNVRFQFTPSTDARLAAKEKLEEEQRHQLPTKQEIPIITDNEREEEDTEDDMKKTKKKITTSKKKKIVPPAPVDDSSEEPNESPISRTTRNRSRNDTDVTSTTQPIKKPLKRSVRNEKKVEPEVIVIETTSPPVPTKRVNRKRPNPKTSTTSPPETTSPTEPVPKRSKTLEVEQPVLVPSPEPTSTRSRSKTPEPVERPPIPKKSKKRSAENHSNENKRKNPITTMKKGKRRLHSVEQDEGLNTADEEETIQTISLPPPEEIKPIELSQEERTKIEGLTVAELKNRLNTHGENIPKGARKADLVALLIKIETNLLKEQKEVQPVVDPPVRKTRRKK